MEPMDIVGRTKEDASLPKATMTKIIKEMLPPDVRVARDTQDLLIECCVEFINLVSSESNEVCNREDKRTIAPEHVLKALESSSCRAVVATVAEVADAVTVVAEAHVDKKQARAQAEIIAQSNGVGLEHQANKQQANNSAECSNVRNLSLDREEQLCNIVVVLGFGEYIEEVYAAYEQHRLETVDTVRSGKWSNGAEMTEEEALAEQQRMFAEARARMNGGGSGSKQSDPETQPSASSNSFTLSTI
ncbi:hypothetical protein SASPL_115041 [Salvia splendens]|uniref:Transcription factor CBF/NF-Y/archaeal histone domain-containing protein n=1 Tax=Salvia splendens TaxID=180675 RepID=A0A8X8Y786_SALSN|nr:hypothetical protein SASPL_115041 [Salvia splendens]